jgi:DNA-binding MarR family transcriptional regulator
MNELGAFREGLLAGVNTLDAAILTMAEKTPDIILHDISSVLKLPGSTLTSAVDRLEKRSFVNRIINRRDRRSFGIELTELGEQACEEHRRQETDCLGEPLPPNITSTE